MEEEKLTLSQRLLGNKYTFPLCRAFCSSHTVYFYRISASVACTGSDEYNVRAIPGTKIVAAYLCADYRNSGSDLTSESER